MKNSIDYTPDLIYKLTDLAEKNSYNLKRLIEIFNHLPIKDNGDLDYLTKFNQCIVDLSDFVDYSNQSLSESKKMVKKYKLLASIILLKANSIEKTENAFEFPENNV